MYYKRNKQYYARSGLNPNKRDKPQEPESPREEPEPIHRIKKYVQDISGQKKAQ